MSDKKFVWAIKQPSSLKVMMKDLPIWKVSGNSPLSLHKLSDDGYKLDFSNENLLVKNKTALEPKRDIPAKMI